MVAQKLATPKLARFVDKILTTEKDVDAVLMINIPLNQLRGLPTIIKKKHNIPFLLYDIDAPTSLPSAGGFTFNFYVGADLSEIDSFIVPSEGSVPELRNLGASKVNIVHFGVDVDAYTPISTVKDIDILFFGNGGSSRENNIKMMITEPSKVLKYKFLVSGRFLEGTDLGNAVVTKPFHVTLLYLLSIIPFAVRDTDSLLE